MRTAIADVFARHGVPDVRMTGGGHEPEVAFLVSPADFARLDYDAVVREIASLLNASMKVGIATATHLSKWPRVAPGTRD